MDINIVATGKIKEKYLKLGIDEFSKRLKSYCKLNIIETAEEKAPESLSEKEEEIIKKKEGEKILSKISEKDYVIALCIEGESIDSKKLASHIQGVFDNKSNTITFIIGGSLGLDEDVLKRADYKLSFSKMTFPHQLMRVILLEQIYRSFRIINKHPYHK